MLYIFKFYLLSRKEKKKTTIVIFPVLTQNLSKSITQLQPPEGTKKLSFISSARLTRLPAYEIFEELS